MTNTMKNSAIRHPLGSDASQRRWSGLESS